MKKIFVSIIALAALVGCNTSMVEQVATTLSAPMEVSLDGNTRLFDNDLKWSWQSDDSIAALQLAGDMTVNTLTLKQNGNFGTDSFKYATDEPSMFMFVYPAEALNASDFSYKFVQTGVWTPTLTGVVSNATIGSFNTVEMMHQSAAFEIRVWEAGRATRKSIKAATITSAADFLNGGNSATVEGLNSDTVVFNLAAGDYDFELTLTDADDAQYTVAVPAQNFVLGKRTVLNVEWKAAAVEPTLSYTILSSYTNKDNSLDGRSIYVKDIVLTDAASATIELYLNGNKAADMTPGQTTTVSNLTPGQYSAVVKWSANGKEYTSEATTVYVTGVPYHADWRNADYSDWKYINCSDQGGYVRINCASSKWSGGYVVGGVISPEFGIPSGGLTVRTSVAASTRATSTSESDRCYIKAGNRNSSTEMSGEYVNILYDESGNTFPNTELVTLESTITLSSSNPCIVYSGETYRIPVIGTNLYTYFYQIKITY